MLVEALPQGTSPADPGAVAASVAERYKREDRRIPGIGHRTHPGGDPRAVRLFEIARETGVYNRYSDLIQRIASAAERPGRRLPVNVTGAIAAIALDMGFPWQITKAFALIGRTLGAVAHVAEEIRNPMARRIDAAVKSALVYEEDSKP